MRRVSGRRVCVTNSITDLPSCIVVGEHRSHCDGRARRVNLETGRTTILEDRECRGCLPRPAERGHLCYDHTVKLDAALVDVQELVVFMWHDGGNGIRDTNDGGHGTTKPSWPLTEARIMVSWITASMRNAVAVLDGRRDIDLTYLDGRQGIARDGEAWAVDSTVPGLRDRLTYGLDTLIGTRYGAEAAIRMTRTIQRAYSKFPLVETEHRIVGIRCANCSQARLVWAPPLMHKGDVTIRCEACQHIERQEWLEQYRSLLQLRPVETTA